MWSLDEYCQTELLRQSALPWSALPESSRQFLYAFQLPTIHPFCEATKLDEFEVEGIPPMGPLLKEEYHHNALDVAITHLYRVLPALFAMGELWLRLFASLIAPIGIAYMIFQEMTIQRERTPSKSYLHSPIVVITVAASVVLLTDSLYILEFGPHYGLLLFVVSSMLALRACATHRLSKTLQCLFLLKLLAGYLVWDGDSPSNISFGDAVNKVTKVPEGLYYNAQNEYIAKIVNAWPASARTYTKESGATPWMPTGDARTGLPFLFNRVPAHPNYHRLWLETHDEEYVALDVAIPQEGHSKENPMYLVLHGLNGGSSEQYVMEFVHRQLAEGSTVVVMVARGLMDLPIKRWNIFHGARTEDADLAAHAIRKVAAEGQILAGVGYSMGAIILANYVARSGEQCPLDAAVAISGGLDMRYIYDYYRAQRLWQPMLAKKLRDTFLISKWAERVRARLSLDGMKKSMRASHVTEIDEHAVAPYHGFDNVMHYYSEMSALGDIPLDAYDGDVLPDSARIHNVAIPLCVVHAFDDPLSTWRTVAANQGLMHPMNLTASVKTGNLMILLTKGGGHVGWPTGWLPFIDKWRWMSDVAITFVRAVNTVSRQQSANRQCTVTDLDDMTCSREATNEVVGSDGESLPLDATHASRTESDSTPGDDAEEVEKASDDAAIYGGNIGDDDGQRVRAAAFTEPKGVDDPDQSEHNERGSYSETPGPGEVEDDVLTEMASSLNDD